MILPNFLCQDLTTRKIVYIIVKYFIKKLQNTMPDTNFLDYLDVILPTAVEQDDLKSLAEQDFLNVITNIN